MPILNNSQPKKHFWSGNLILKWDSTTMPMVNADLQVTKNEISLQVFMSKNSGRAGKVLEGASTDMEDMLNLCNFYHIDICQFMKLPDGTHPVMLHRSELERLEKAANGVKAAGPCEGIKEAAPCEVVKEAGPCEVVKEAVAGDMRYLNDKNVGQLIDCIAAKDAKIAELYERIVEMMEENTRLKVKLENTSYLRHDMVADDSGQR